MGAVSTNVNRVIPTVIISPPQKSLISFGHIFGHILNFKNKPAKLVSILVIKISPLMG